MANINSVQGNPIVLGMTGLASDVYAEFDSKMDVDGYYPMYGITGGGPLDTAAWLSRACPGSDGPARIESIHGRTVRWNQLTSDAKPASDSTVNGVTITNNHDGTFTLNGTASAATIFNVGDVTVGTSNHKILIKGCPSGGAVGTYRLKDGYGINSDIGSGVIDQATNNNTIAQIAIASGYTCDNLVFRPQLFDLTRMFGAGNEPSTVAEFEELYPDAYYPYDAGSLQPVRMTGVESVGDGWTFQRAIDAGVLRGAGTVYDEQTATEHITRVREVVLSEISWMYDAQNKRFSSPIISTIVQTVDAAHPLAQTARLDLLAPGGTVEAVDGFTVSSGMIWVSVEASAPTIATSEALNTWLAANCPTMHVALATPTVTPIDPALNLTYRAAQGGTERILHDEPTAPPTLVVQYGSTADGIRDRALAAIATLEGSVSQHNYSVGDYLTFDGHLCRVTVAIATGESIVIGSNVAVTTVMEEVLSLLS